MRYLIIGGLLALVAIVGGGEVLGRRLPGPLQYLSRTGIGFLLLGVLLGPLALDWFDDTSVGGPTLRVTLEPITALALAWIGMLYGCHLEVARLRRFGRGLFGVMWLEGTLAMACVALATAPILWAFAPPASATDALAAACFCGAAAAGTAPAALFLLRQEIRMSGPIYERLLFFCSLDDLPGLLVLAGVFALFRTPLAPDTLGGLGWLVLTLAIGLSLAVLSRFALRPGLDDEHTFLVLLGALGLAAGACGVLHLSPLIVGVIAGATFINTSRQKERVYEALQAREHTIYILFLVLAGSLVRVDPAHAVLLPLLIATVMAARLLGKAVGAAGPRTVGAGAAVPWRASLALVPQGGMTVAMAASFAHTYPGPLAQTAAAATVLAVVVNDLLGAEVAPLALRGVRD